MLSEEAIFENGLNLGNQRLICFYLGTDNKYAKFHACITLWSYFWIPLPHYLAFFEYALLIMVQSRENLCISQNSNRTGWFSDKVSKVYSAKLQKQNELMDEIEDISDK